MKSKRKIIHIDMDAFFASIEQREDPSLEGKPVIIAGDPNKRGVVSTCSYEARKYGIYSSMPTKTALRLCPNGVFVKPRIEYYKAVSDVIFDIYKEYSDLVEPLSLDEAFLDVTENHYGMESTKEIVTQIKGKIRQQVNLTASAGISFNKFFAKLASDMQKPNGLTEINEDNFEAIIDEMDIKKFFGIGKVSLEMFHKLGIYKGKDLKRVPEEKMYEFMYKRGSVLYKNIRGEDDREVEPDRQRKSMGKEITLEADISGEEMYQYFIDVANRLARDLKKKNVKGKVITIKVKNADFRIFTRRMTCNDYIQDSEEILNAVDLLLSKNNFNDYSIRLIGIYLSDLLLGEEEDNRQMTIWDMANK